MSLRTSALPRLLLFAICLTYFFGGIVGLYLLLPVSTEFMGSWLAMTLFGLLVIQNIVAVYGSIRFFRHDAAGGRMLYWLSWTSVPVFSSELISYHSIIGLGITPVMRLVEGNYGMDVLFQIGYEGALKWFPTYDIYQLGINLVPLVFIAIIRQLIHINPE